MIVQRHTCSAERTLVPKEPLHALGGTSGGQRHFHSNISLQVYYQLGGAAWNRIFPVPRDEVEIACSFA